MAALTQSARLPGPSWDEEVVPALRKRLESESRTLAKRMSAASLASSSDGPPTPQHPSFSAAFSDASIPGYTALPSSSSPSNYSHVNPNTPTTPRARHHYHPPPDRSMTSVSSPGDHAANLNGYTSSTSAATPNAASQQTSATSTSSPSPSFQRSRAVSQPYLADLPNGTTRSRAKSRPPDIKTTRIPKASRYLAGGNGGSSAGGVNNSNESNNRVYQTQLAATASRSTISVPSAQNSGLLHEPPPFSAATSGHGHGSMLGHGGGEAAPASADEPTRSQQLQSKYPYLQQSEARKSGESERLAYEHWYRGDASRNGGVGELRVGTRMEMLEIANYGHKYSKRNSGVVVAKRQVPWVVEEGWRRRRNEMMMMMSRQSSSSTGSGSGSMMSTSISTELAAAAGIGQYQSRRQSLKRGHRPRADSIAGVGTKGREYEFDRERESFYLDDDDDVDGIGRVLDESPLTDIDGEGEFSDIASDSEAHYFHSEERREREFGGFGGVGGPGGGRSFSSSYAQQKHTLAHSPEPIGHEGDSGSGDAHSPSADDARSTTPTPTVKTHRQQSSSSSRNTATTVHHQQTSASTTTGANGNAASGALPPSRIPVPPSRKSTDTTRSPTPTPSILNRVSPEMPPPPLPAAAAANPPRSATPSSLRQNSSSTGIPTTSTLGKNSLSNGSAPGAPTSTSTSGAQPAAVPSTPMKRGTSTSPTPQQQQAPGSTVKSPRKSTTNNTATKANRAKHEAMRREQAEEARRKNKGQYPSLPGGEEDDSSGDGGGERGDGLEHAIPVWTQPVVRGEGGWDDVVLPAVARKKGLDGYYEQKDGRSSGAKRKVEDEMPAPAPGTFGFDHSKIRGPKDSTTTSPTESPLDEFGQQRPNADGKSDSSKEDDSSSKNNSASSEEEATQSQLQRQQEQEQEEEYKPPTTTPHDKIKLPVSRPILASERPPFSDYPAVSEKTVVAITGNGNASTSARANGNAQGEMVMMVDLEKGRNGNGKGDAYEDEEDKGAGCCRCVIM